MKTKKNEYFAFWQSIKNIETNNTDHIFDCFVLEEYCGNRLAIYKGNVSGYFLIVTHENKPVEIVYSAFNKKEIFAFVEKATDDADEIFNYVDDYVTAMYIIHYFYNRESIPLLLAIAKDRKSFIDIDACYQAVAEKFENYVNANSYFDPANFTKSLGDEETNLAKFLTIINAENDSIPQRYKASLVFSFEKMLDNSVFESYGISDLEIDALFRKHKINISYYKREFSLGKNPSVYFLENGCVGSYLNQSDELALYRAGIGNLKQNYDSVIEGNY